MELSVQTSHRYWTEWSTTRSISI